MNTGTYTSHSCIHPAHGGYTDSSTIVPSWGVALTGHTYSTSCWQCSAPRNPRGTSRRVNKIFTSPSLWNKEPEEVTYSCQCYETRILTQYFSHKVEWGLHLTWNKQTVQIFLYRESVAHPALLPSCLPSLLWSVAPLFNGPRNFFYNAKSASDFHDP